MSELLPAFVTRLSTPFSNVPKMTQSDGAVAVNFSVAGGGISAAQSFPFVPQLSSASATYNHKQ